MEKLLAMLDVFRKGSAITNAAAWKNHQVTATMLAVLIVSLVRLAKGFGYDLPIDEDSATALGGGIIAFVNIVLVYITSDKVGLLQQKPADVVGTTDTPVIAVVQAEVPTVVQQKPNELVSTSYLREAREALAKRDAEQASGINTGA